MPGPCWIAAKTQNSRERWASENVARQGREFYLPRIKDERGRSKYLFPGYIFVCILDRRWTFLTGTFGVAHVLMGGGADYPARIARSFIEDLKDQEDGTGHVILPPPPLDLNQAVKITGGALCGQIGLYRGRDSQAYVKILFEILGRETITRVSNAFVQPLTA